MHHVVTALLVLLGFVAGTVVGGVVSSQGRAFDPFPFIVGAIVAVVTLALRLRPAPRR